MPPAAGAGPPALPGTPSDTAPALLCIRGARILAPEDRGIADILILGERIAAIAQDLPAIPDRLPRFEVEARGLIAMPGLIDGHLHLIGGGGEGGPLTRAPRVRFEDLVRAGVTTAVGVLGFDAVTRHLDELLVHARALEALGLSTRIYTGAYQLPVQTLTGTVERDIVLIDKVIGVGEVAISDHRSSAPQAEELATLAARARIGGILAGKPGLLHLHLGDGRQGMEPLFRILDATDTPPRQLYPTHVNRSRRLWEEAKHFARRGAPVDLTAACTPELDNPEAVPPELALAEWLGAGLPLDRLTLSSDGNGSLPLFDEEGRLLSVQWGRVDLVWQKLASMWRGGLPPEAVLPLATRNPARWLGLKDRGRLRPGLRADLCLVSADLTIEWVFAGGVPLLQAGSLAGHGPLATPVTPSADQEGRVAPSPA